MDWKNLTQNPNIVIRGDIIKFGDLYSKLDKAVGFLRHYKKTLINTINQISRLDISIKEHEKKLTEEKNAKKIAALHKSLDSLKRHGKTLVAKNKKVQRDFIKYSAESYLNFVEIIKVLYELNIQCLTLIHRCRNDIDNLISKVKKLKHVDTARLEQLKSESISKLNKSKKRLKDITDKLYRSSEHQDRSAFNPAEVIREISIQSTTVKVRRIRQMTIEIDNIEDKIDPLMKSIVITGIPWFVDQNLNHQIMDFDRISHHIKILNHRVHKLIYQYPEDKKLRKTFKKVLKRLVKQTRTLWNSIKIEHYKRKPVKEEKIIQFPKREEIKKYRKAA